MSFVDETPKYMRKPDAVRGSRAAKYRGTPKSGIHMNRTDKQAERRLWGFVASIAAGVGIVALANAIGEAKEPHNPYRVDIEDVRDHPEDYDTIRVDLGDSPRSLAEDYSEIHEGTNVGQLTKALSAQAKADGDPNLHQGEVLHVPRDANNG